MAYSHDIQHPRSSTTILVRGTIPAELREKRDGEKLGILKVSSLWQELIKIPWIEDAPPGSFISAAVSRLGGKDNLDRPTTIRLWLGNQQVVKISFEQAKIMGLTQNNPYGITYFKGGQHMVTERPHPRHKDIETLTFGFPQPLNFSRRDGLLLQVYNRDSSVGGIYANVIYSGLHNGEGTDSGGGEPMFP